MFQQLRQLVQQDPSMLENVLQQVSAANPQLAQLISQNPEQFLQLVTEGVEGDGLPMPPGASGDIRVTEEERDAIERVSLSCVLFAVSSVVLPFPSFRFLPSPFPLS